MDIHADTAFNRAVELLGRRWTGGIVLVLFNGSRRYSQLAVAVPGVSGRLLSQRLVQLVELGIIERRVLATTPPQVEYSLTESGRALRPVVDAVIAWTQEWQFESERGTSAFLPLAAEHPEARFLPLAAEHPQARSLPPLSEDPHPQPQP